jgi:hypothetical protein
VRVQSPFVKCLLKRPPAARSAGGFEGLTASSGLRRGGAGVAAARFFGAGARARRWGAEAELSVPWAPAADGAPGARSGRAALAGAGAPPAAR